MKQVKQKKFRAVLVVCLIVLFTGVNFAYATVIGFDDLYLGLNKSSTSPIPANYADYMWSSHFQLMTKEYATTGTSGVGYTTGMFGNVVGYTSGPAGTNLVEITSETPFDFVGAYITSAWKMNQDVLVQGYYNGEIMYTANIFTSCNQAHWFEFNFKNIDSICITPGQSGTDYYSNYRGNHLAIDNITLVPEPATLILVGLGGLGLRLGKRDKV